MVRVERPPPAPLPKSSAANPPMQLSYHSTAMERNIDREVRRRWRRLHLQRAIGVAATILTAILVIGVLMAWRFKFFLLRKMF
jgi:hypothetical protein